MKSIRISLLGFFSCLFALSYAGSDQDKVAELKKRAFIVCVLEEDQEAIQGFKNDTAKIGKYKRAVQNHNKYFKECVQKYWTFHKVVEYKTYKEVEAIKQDPSLAKKYAYIDAHIYAIYTSDGMSPKTLSTQIGYIQVYLMDVSKSLTYVTLPAIYPGELEFIYGVRQACNFIKGMEQGLGKPQLIKQNGPRLKDKILLLNSKEADPKVKVKGFGEDLPFKIKLVSQAEIDAAVKSSDPKYAYIILSNEGDGVYVKVAVACDDSSLLGFSIGGGLVTKGNLKDFAKSVD